MDRDEFKTEVDPAELRAEQQYFDSALDHRESQRRSRQETSLEGGTQRSASAIRESFDERLRLLQPPDAAVAFGRFDTEEGERWYVGYDAIWDDDQQLLVISWLADAARPFVEASADDRMGLRLRRHFKTAGNKILSFDDVVFAELAADVARLLAEPTVGDPILDALERSRTGEMVDIVKTIQAAQSKLMRMEMDQVLIIQGGPGTGKTAVALHRVSWLLYKFRDKLKPKDVLVFGPNKTFVRYIRGVLPMLGDEDVQHTDVAGLLGAAVRVTAKDSPSLAGLKGERRMTSLLQRALQDRINPPQDDVEVRTTRGLLRIPRDEILRDIRRSIELSYNGGRQRLRELVRNYAINRVGPDAVRIDALDKLTDRIWPPLTPASFLQELFGSEGRLLRAAGDDFSAAEVQLLYRRSAERLSEQEWSVADVPLLDHADYLIRGQVPRQFGHIVVDEAQDVSHMELLMLTRRCTTGSMTVVGDIAQSTGPWARDDWDDVVEALSGTLPVIIHELELGYRVPRQIYELAARILPTAAPAVTPPRIVREGQSDPELRQVSLDQRASAAVERARAYAADGNFVGIITPEETRDEIESVLDERRIQWVDADQGQLGHGINVLNPTHAKGLEFDAVVVVEPEVIIAEDPRGLRLLYVCLTRTTSHLAVIFSRATAVLVDLNDPALPELDSESTEKTWGQPHELTNSVARALADQVRQLATTPALQEELLAALRAELRDE